MYGLALYLPRVGPPQGLPVPHESRRPYLDTVATVSTTPRLRTSRLILNPNQDKGKGEPWWRGFRGQTEGEAGHKNVSLTFVMRISFPVSCKLFNPHS